MRGRDRTWRFWIFQSKLLSVKRRIATFFVSESLAVRVSRRVLEPRLLVRFVSTRGRDRYSWFWVFRIEVLSVEEGKVTFLGLSQKSPKLQTSILRVVEIRLMIRFLL
ncbi:hypothetical protein LINPERHAP2_LOCUS19195 [Linum perenne]